MNGNKGKLQEKVQKLCGGCPYAEVDIQGNVTGCTSDLCEDWYQMYLSDLRKKSKEVGA